MPILKVYRKLLVTTMLIILNLAMSNAQTQNVVGVFRNLEVDESSVTYVEFKTDFTVIIKRLSLVDSFDVKKVVISAGVWKINGDTVVLNFAKDAITLRGSAPPELKYLIKNEDVLYTFRLGTGKFVRDSFLRKAKGRLVRMSNKLFEEYSKISLPN